MHIRQKHLLSLQVSDISFEVVRNNLYNSLLNETLIQVALNFPAINHNQSTCV